MTARGDVHSALCIPFNSAGKHQQPKECSRRRGEPGRRAFRNHVVAKGIAGSPRSAQDSAQKSAFSY